MRRVRSTRRHVSFAVTPIAATPPRTIWSSMLPEPASRYASGAIGGIVAHARSKNPRHRGDALGRVVRDQQRDSLEQLAIVGAEGGGAVGVDVDLPDDAALVGDRHDDLGACRGEAGEIARVGIDVVDDLGLSARRGGAAHSLAD